MKLTVSTFRIFKQSLMGWCTDYAYNQTYVNVKLVGARGAIVHMTPSDVPQTTPPVEK